MLRTFIRNKQITGKSELLKRYVAFQFVSKSNIRTSLGNKKKENVEEDESNEPIKLSTSKAATWKAIDSRVAPTIAPPYQSFIVSASLMVFCFYFFVLREENDLDLLIVRGLNESEERSRENQINNVQNTQ